MTRIGTLAPRYQLSIASAVFRFCGMNLIYTVLQELQSVDRSPHSITGFGVRRLSTFWDSWVIHPSIIEHKRLAVNERPENVLVGLLLVLLVLFDVLHRVLHVLRSRLAAPGPHEQFRDLLLVGTRILRQGIGP